MPKKTYGSQVKKRVKRLLEALLFFVDGEFEDGSFDIKHNDWINESSTNPKLIVQTTLAALELLTQKDKYSGKLTKAQIRDALKLLDKDSDDSLLKILEDNRATKRGSENWHFTLKLWSKDKQENLKRFDEVWENNRPSKSKAVEASYQLDDAVAPVLRPKSNIFQAPPLPTYYVDRPEYSQDLKTRLLTESNDVRTLVVTAIHGLGSVGKSTLATALAHDQQVQSHFCDGILWTTLGQQPNLLSLLSGWVQALGDYNFKATSVEAASNQLRTLLYDKAVLLVVDDAWNPEDAQAFNVGGARCQVLVTTREAGIAQILGASTYSLDVMKPSQAMELLAKKLGRNLTDAENQLAEALAQELGYLPLALELAAAQVAGGTPWTILVQDMQQEVARLKTLDNKLARDAADEASFKKLSLTASLNLSIQRLSDDTRENFIWLGILPEDITITGQMAVTLWDMDDERDTADELSYLHSKALLLSGIPLVNGTPTYRLHDLFHDLARNLLTSPSTPKHRGDLPGLGITLAHAHAAFLEKYRQKTQNGLWHTLPSDGYIHQHLVQHLEKAQKVEEIHSLLREESKTGANGWYEACDRLGQTANFVTDVARAWQLADDSCTETTLPQVIGLQCRYALIIASLNSLAANLPAQLLIALVQKSVWTPQQGLAYVLQSSNPTQKANLLIELVNHLPPNLKKLGLRKALVAAKEIQSESSRAYTLSRLASILPEVLTEALAAARKIQDEYERTYALNILTDKLPEVLPEALAAARKIQDEYERTYALNVLIDKLPELLPETLVTAKEIQDEVNRAYALSNLAVMLPPELLPEVLVAAKEIQDESSRAYVLSNLADILPPEVLPEVLAAARKIQDELNRAYALSNLAVMLPPELLPEVLVATREIQSESIRAYALSSLAGILPELLPEALAAARESQPGPIRDYALSNFADILPPELLPEALAAARKIQDESSRAYALSSLAGILPELLSEALAAAREIQSEKDRAYALSSLAGILPELLPEALAAARKIQDELSRVYALSDLVGILPELLPEALAAARKIQSEEYRAYALSNLAGILPELLPEALAAARKIQSEEYRAYALSNLVGILPELLPEVLAATREIQSESIRAYTLSTLADKLPPELLSEVLAAAREIKDERHRAYTLSSLAGILPAELLSEVLAAAKKIQDEYNRADALSSLAGILPELLPEALAAAREIQDELSRADALSSLALQLSQIQKTPLFDHWRDTLNILSVHTRPNLLSDINTLIPVIFTLGGKQAVKDTASAIQDVSRWWS
ncbi:regulatory protein (plasmid) [Nostoc sp. NIES-2111]|nr:regulatory protein [Nostoc sp. NIES-2111]